jgi:excinuclease ABC subunit B
MEEVGRRREKQLAYNQAHGITPRSVKRGVQASLHVYDGAERKEAAVAEAGYEDVAAVIAGLEEEMQEAANKLEFERAALLRDQINSLKSGDYKKPAAGGASYRAPAKKPRRTGRG